MTTSGSPSYSGGRRFAWRQTLTRVSDCSDWKNVNRTIRADYFFVIFTGTVFKFQIGVTFNWFIDSKNHRLFVVHNINTTDKRCLTVNWDTCFNNIGYFIGLNVAYLVLWMPTRWESPEWFSSAVVSASPLSTPSSSSWFPSARQLCENKVEGMGTLFLWSSTI